MKGRRPQTNKQSIETTKAISGTPPDWMGKYAGEVWRKTIEDLEAESRPIHQLNTQMLIGFAEAAGLVRECAEIIAKEGMLIDGGRYGKKRHPAVGMRLAALSALRGYASELGLTPGASGRLPAVPASRGPAEPWLIYLREHRVEELAEYVAEHGCEPTNEFSID